MIGFEKKYTEKVLHLILNEMIKKLFDNRHIYSLPLLLMGVKGVDISLATMTRIKQQYCKDYDFVSKHNFDNNIDELLKSEDLSEKVTYIYHTLFENNQRLFKDRMKSGDFNEAKKHLFTAKNHLEHINNIKNKYI